MKNITCIQFVLENCEVINVDLDSEGWYSGIIGRTWASYHWQKDWLSKYVTTNYIKLTFETEHFKPYFSNQAGAGAEADDALKRLQYGDITSIVFQSKKKTFTIGVPWRGLDDYHNKAYRFKRDITNYYDHIVLEFNNYSLLRKFILSLKQIGYFLFDKFRRKK